MAIEIVDLPVNSMVIFQFAMLNYQRVIQIMALWFLNDFPYEHVPPFHLNWQKSSVKHCYPVANKSLRSPSPGFRTLAGMVLFARLSKEGGQGIKEDREKKTHVHLIRQWEDSLQESIPVNLIDMCIWQITLW